MNSQAQLSAAQQLATGGGAAPTLESSGVSGGDDDDDIPELEAPEDDGPVDETGVDPKDIDLVMAQVRIFEPYQLTDSDDDFAAGQLLAGEGRTSAEREWW